MKILYIVPKINNEGGVARVLSLKANYLVQKMNYEIHILTQNKGNTPLFYDFDSKIQLHDAILSGNPINFIVSYKKALNKWTKQIEPDAIFVLDNGLKPYLLPSLLHTKTPVYFEVHGSKYVQEKKVTNTIVNYFSIKIKEIGIKKYTNAVFLSKESAAEWDYKNPIIIPNPVSFSVENTSNLASKKVIAVARHSYEKGLDRMLQIWQKVIVKHPDWHLVIYGNSNKKNNLEKLAQFLKIENNITFHEPVKNIIDKYLETSLFLMTSRTEGFPMVLLEAMACGLPCIAYNCPIGPRAIIDNNKNGFLIENDYEDLYIEKINYLIENNNIRIMMGKKAKEYSSHYDLDSIMARWINLFENIIQQ